MSTRRRQFIKASALSELTTMIGGKAFSNFTTATKCQAVDGMVRPTFSQMEWQDAEFGALFHFDISIAAKNSGMIIRRAKHLIPKIIILKH